MKKTDPDKEKFLNVKTPISEMISCDTKMDNLVSKSKFKYIF